MKAFKSDKIITRLFALILAAAVLLSSCAFERQEEETTLPAVEPESRTVPEGIMTVPFTSLDPVNPFFCTSLLNASVISLVYRSLYRMDGGFSPVRDMAAEETVNGKTVLVTIEDDLVFSDARPVSSDDIVYSFELAKESRLWKKALSGVKNCTAEGNFTVRFEFDEADVNALNVLTFPVAQRGTADTREALPVSLGCYKYEKDELRLSLVGNLRYAGTLSDIGTVRLYDVTDSSSLMHLLDTGMIDCFFSDLSDGTAKRTYSSVSEVYLNNLIFLGLNHESYRLSLADVRRAVSRAVDRRALAENAFLNHARAAWLPFNMSWTAITESPFAKSGIPDSDIRAADTLLDGAGCGISGDKIYLELICRDSNSFMKNTAALIAEELALVNMDVTVKLLSDDEFTAALEEGEYDMYLSEIKLTKNMDLSPFFTSGGTAAYGLSADKMNIDDIYFSYKRGETELDEFLAAFDESMPFIPLLFRNGQFCYSRSLSGVTDVTENALFAGVSAWTRN